MALTKITGRGIGSVILSSDTASGDDANIGFTAAEGLILTGQGSTNDVTIKNDADANVIQVPTGTTNVTIGGNLSVGGDLDVTGNMDMSDANLTNVGTIALDSLSGDGDANTTIAFSGSDVITFTTGGTAAATLNASQLFTANAGVASTTGNFSGVVTANAGVVVDNITIDGTEIDLSSGDLLVDVAGDITLDAGGSEILLNVATTAMGHISMASSNLTIKSLVSDKDMIFQGNDGGSAITALTLDMSAAGAAVFNNNVTAFSDERLKSNIVTVPDALAKVTAMRGVHYTRDDTGRDHTGVIAQEIQKIAPEVVLTADDEINTLSVDYGNITGYLIEAIKELKAEIEELKNGSKG